MRVAHHKCRKCGTEWHVGFTGGDLNGPYAFNIAICPICKHNYSDWLNYPIKEENKCSICHNRNKKM